MKQLYRLYIFSLAGALGGLVGSLLHQRLLLDILTTQLQPGARYGYLALLGGLVGAPLGFFPTFAEGKANYSLGGAIRMGLLGALLGGLSGIIALPLAEWLHTHLGGGLKGRVTSWVLLGVIIGGFVGVAESRVGGARAWRSILGGAFGGVIAGVLLERLLSNPATGASRQQSAALAEQTISAGHAALNQQAGYSDSGIWALFLLGLFIALFIALFVNVFADARLEGQPGSKVHGHVYYLDKFREPHLAVLGSDKTPQKTFIYIPDAELTHAGITLTPRGALLRHLANKGETLVGNMPVKEHILHDGELIEVGSARLIYKERRKASAVTSVPTNSK
jgi:hypothetical protein